jgi:hypothetical protein
MWKNSVSLNRLITVNIALNIQLLLDNFNKYKHVDRKCSAQKKLVRYVSWL